MLSKGLLSLGGSPSAIFRPKVNSTVLSFKELVVQLANDYMNSDFCTSMSESHGGGLSGEERVRSLSLLHIIGKFTF